MQIQTFLYQTSYDDLPDGVIRFSKRCLLDLIAVMIAGSQTKLADLITQHAVEQFGPGKQKANIMFSNVIASPTGAALANGMMIDSIDAHDGFKLVKGHIGCHVLPAILAFRQAENLSDGRDFLTDLVVGYEFGARAGLALHASAPDYHTSGAWGAVTAAALGARILKLDTEQTRHAMGIGEYHGPRSQMMRCIDHPTMLKDGSGWGAMAGVSAAYLARSGFTGAPAITVEGNDVSEHWDDLGSRWTMPDQYFKPYPVCRWAQPATAAALSLIDRHQITHDDIDRIEVFSFHEACRLATRAPIDTEQAQYSLPFPVAAALVFGKISPAEIDGKNLHDPRVLALSQTMKLSETNEYNAAFPQDRFAHVWVTLKNGDTLKSERHQAIGDPETPLSDEEIIQKFYGLANPVVGEERADAIKETIDGLGDEYSLTDLLNHLTPTV